MTATVENERHELVRRIFASLDASEPNDAQNIRESSHTVWDKLFRLGEELESAARHFDGKERMLLMEEYRRIQLAIAIVGESYLPVIMPDEEMVGP